MIDFGRDDDLLGPVPSSWFHVIEQGTKPQKREAEVRGGKGVYQITPRKLHLPQTNVNP